MTGPDPYLPGGEGPGTSKPSVLDYAAKLASLLALALAILLQLTRKHTPILWAFLAATLILVAVSLYPSLKLALRRRIQRGKDRRATKRALPQFRKFAHRFGDFVNTSTSDTLHYILQNEACQGSTDRFAGLGIPELRLWNGFWQHFAQRLDRQRQCPAELKYALQEFYDLVGLYDTLCVIRIFNNPPPEFRGGLTPATKNSLNLFQQRFERFLASYEEFAKALGESRPAFEDLASRFSHPKPL
jgi:hypothetical protein